MPDTRLPDSWLNNPLFDDLSDAAWRTWTGGLMWANHRGTDGAIPLRYLRMLHPDGEQPAAANELIRASLWRETPEGYQVNDWEGVGQSTAASIESGKAAARERQAAKRLRDAGLSPKPPRGTGGPTFSPAGDVASDITRDVGRDVGQEGQAGIKSVDSAEISDAKSGVWPTVAAPGSGGISNDVGVDKKISPPLFMEIASRQVAS
jgi:hypothetical protein